MRSLSFLKKLSQAAITLFLLFILLLFSCFPKRYMQICADGIALWATCVLPSSLPFLFLTALLTQTGSVSRLSKILNPITAVLFGISGVGGYCLLMSFLCGYPVGAKTVSDLKENGIISPSEATKMSALCSSSGPLFILGSVGMGIFNNAKVGTILLSSHLLAVLLSGLIFRFYKTDRSSARLPDLRRFDNVLYECMLSSVLTALCVGGFVAIFYTLSYILNDWGLLLPLRNALTLLGMDEKIAEGLARGLVEMTGGCNALAFAAAPANIAGCAFLITFGGVSILFQQICFLKKAEVKLQFFLPVKVLQSFLAALIAFLLSIAAQ